MDWIPGIRLGFWHFTLGLFTWKYRLGVLLMEVVFVRAYGPSAQRAILQHGFEFRERTYDYLTTLKHPCGTYIYPTPFLPFPKTPYKQTRPVQMIEVPKRKRIPDLKGCILPV